MGNKRTRLGRAKVKKAKKQTRAQIAKVPNAGAIRRKTAAVPKRPRTAPLPGMEDIGKYSRPLLNIMDSMADVKHRQNEDAATLKGLVNNAISQMKRDGVSVAKAHGIELARVPGEEKLRVRLLHEGSGEVETEEAGEQGENELDNGEEDIIGDEAEESLANA